MYTVLYVDIVYMYVLVREWGSCNVYVCIVMLSYTIEILFMHVYIHTHLIITIFTHYYCYYYYHNYNILLTLLHTNTTTITIQTAWDINKTIELIKERNRIIQINLENRIKTTVEREYYARNIIKKEIIEKTMKNDLDGIKILFNEILIETIKTKQKPRATVEIRNEYGQSLLSIAAQYDYIEIANFLLTYYIEINNEYSLYNNESELCSEAKIYKSNVNSRDLKGWSCICIAIFHNSKKVLQCLLEHGGDPNIRSSYNKNAWDLAKV